ncbi:MafI family immunity protein [Micromonospora chokoriensis]|uniref:MafI family immunity protein n=1 Tax=Micromonospora chokoriensis TaxID=356851 RepID=A0A1C4Y204_9ACTN|nr:MafI family immunity protein [Micromonospora chokoriensis]SCF14743.1 hypothetical protein GA0070612_4199 [Micromonospora chokoriensis]
MYFGQLQAAVLDLVADAPLLRPGIRADVRDHIRAGEVGLAFETLCEFLYEDALPLSRAYYDRLEAMTVELEDVTSLHRLDELVT